MHIAVFIKNTHFHKSFGGMETQNKVLVESLASLGHVVYVYSPAKELREVNTTENAVRYIFVPCVFKKFSLLHKWQNNDWRYKSYEYFLEDHNKTTFDIVLCQSSSGLGLLQHKKTINLKIISISHGSKMGEFLSRLRSLSSIKEVINLAIDVPHVLYAFFFTQREFIHGSDKIIAVSSAVKSALVDETFVQESRIVVINNGIKSVLTQTNLSSKKPNVVTELLYVGRVIRAKGLFLLIDVLANLKELPWNMTVIGDGEDMNSLSQKIQEFSLGERVKLLGKVSHEVAMNAMLTADIFLLPSIRIEGLPMVLIEAMFAGLPVIATDVGGNSDAVRDGQTGYLIPSGSKSALQEKLVDLIKDPVMREQMGKNARLLAEQDFTEHVMVNKYLQVIKEVLDENP